MKCGDCGHEENAHHSVTTKCRLNVGGKPCRCNGFVESDNPPVPCEGTLPSTIAFFGLPQSMTDAEISEFMSRAKDYLYGPRPEDEARRIAEETIDRYNRRLREVQARKDKPKPLSDRWKSISTLRDLVESDE